MQGEIVTETSTAARQMQRCEERYILQGRMRADTRVYIDATRRLESCQPEDFDEIWEAAQSAQRAFLIAREVLKAHIAEHGCER